MFNPRDYKLVLVKKEKKEPVRLERVVDDGWTIHQKLNIIIFILLILLFSVLCFILVPPTYGFFRY